MSGYKATFFVVDPDKVELELTIKMTLGDWKKLKDQITSGGFPSWQLGNTISDMVMKANRHFQTDSEGLQVV